MEQMTQMQDWTKVSEIEITYRSKIKASERPIVKSSLDIFRLLSSNWNLDLIEIQEQFKVVLLNRAMRILGIINLSTGGKTSTIADLGLILAAAIKAGAFCIILAHNHPSGNLQPSQADLILTEKIKLAAGYHDVRVYDHIILSTEGYYSFADEGVL